MALLLLSTNTMKGFEMSEMDKLEMVLQSDMKNVPDDLVLGYRLWLFKKSKFVRGYVLDPKKDEIK